MGLGDHLHRKEFYVQVSRETVILFISDSISQSLGYTECFWYMITLTRRENDNGTVMSPYRRESKKKIFLQSYLRTK